MWIIGAWLKIMNNLFFAPEVQRPLLDHLHSSKEGNNGDSGGLNFSEHHICISLQIIQNLKINWSSEVGITELVSVILVDHHVVIN